MKRLIFIVLVMGLLGACQQDLDTYSGVDYIYFEGTQDSVFFSYAYVDGEVQSDSMWVWVRMSGQVTDYDREIKLKVAETNGRPGEDYVALAETYTLEKGYTFVAIPVVLLRPEILKKEERYLVLELQENADFRLMLPSQPVNQATDKRYSKVRYKIVYSEILNTPPKGWYDTYFGTFSVKKLDKMCQELNMTRVLFDDVTYVNPRKEYIATKMVKILNAAPVYEDDGVTPMRMGDMYYQ